MSDLNYGINNFELLENERKKYMQRKILLQTVSKCISPDSDLNEELKNKVQNIILNAEVNTTMNLTTRYSEEKILGLSELSNVELSFNEQEKLEEAVSNNLKLTQGNIHSSGHKSVEAAIGSFNLNMQDRVLLDASKSLNDLQETYMKHLNVFYELLQQLVQLRCNDLKHVAKHKIDEYSIKSKMYSLRSELIKEKSRVDIFNENSISLAAYKELLNDISIQQRDCQEQIDELNLMKEKYEFVSCLEYEEILKLYLQYKNAIQKKKMLYEQLKK